MNDCLRQIQQGIYEGSERQLAELYRLFSRRLLHFSRTITHSASISEEVVEDVFVKLWARRAQLKAIDNLSVYLYIAVKNRSLNAVAQKGHLREMEMVDIDAVDPGSDPYNELVSADMMQQMQQAVDNLPPRCRLIFKLIREDGLKYKEVAEILGISVNTIDAQMAIAIKRICGAMPQDFLSRRG